MTNTNNSNKSSTFNFESKEAAIALYLDSVAGREAIEKELADHAEYQSGLCKALLEQFGTKDEETGKFSLQLDLGDGSPRGHIVVMRERKDAEPLYFIRERNTGRPVGSKNKATKKAQETVAAVVAEERPEIVTEGEPVSEIPAATAASEAPKTTLSPMEQALAVADADLASQAASTPSQAPSTGDVVVDAILQVSQNAIEALKAHSASRSVAPAAGAAE